MASTSPKSGSGDLFISAGGSSPGCSGSARAVVGSGYVGAAALVGTLTSSPTGGNAVASASVNYSLTISTPASYTGGDIPVQVLFGLFGSVGGSTDTNASENSLRQARIDAVYTLTGLSSSGRGSDSGRIREEFLATEYDTTNGSSFAFGGSGFAPIASNVLSIDPTSGLLVSFTLQAEANMVSFDNQVAVSADAFDTFGFAADGPSFILPDGFFINSTEASIVNNYWIDPRSPVGPSPVPLPASLPLLFAGGMLLAAVGRSRRKSRC